MNKDELKIKIDFYTERLNILKDLLKLDKLKTFANLNEIKNVESILQDNITKYINLN